VTKRATVLVVVAVLAAVFASLAFAGGNSSSSATYKSKGAKIQRSVKPKAPKTPTNVTHPSVSKGGGTLPFTGLDLAFIAGGGVLLVAMGGSLRRLTRKPPAA
jgi:hypothetical protein